MTGIGKPLACAKNKHYAHVYNTCKDAYKGTAETEKTLIQVGDSTATIYLRVQVRTGAKCRFGYSLDGNNFTGVEADQLINLSTCLKSTIFRHLSPVPL